MGQARKEEDEEEEEEAVTAREAGPDLVSSAGNLTAINLINVQQQPPAATQVSRHGHEHERELLSCIPAEVALECSRPRSILGCSFSFRKQQLCSRTRLLFPPK